jgi:N-methylhydantoinase A
VEAQPTVTDANLLLGRLRADRFLGGDFVLDTERTRKVVAQWLKQQGSRWPVEEFAMGVLRVVNANMEKAIRAVSIEKGHDPRDFTLVAFGGAGALHACELARALQIPRVLVPQAPGALSAYGILASDVVKEFSRTVMLTAAAANQDRVRAAARALETAVLDSFSAEGWEAKSAKAELSLDLRYRGQGFELNVPFSRVRLKEAVSEFHEQHRRRYGYADLEHTVEVVNVRVRGTLSTKTPKLMAKKAVAAESSVASVYFGGKPVRTKIIARESLRLRRRIMGPAIITEYSATTVVPPGAEVVVDEVGNMRVTVG